MESLDRRDHEILGRLLPLRAFMPGDLLPDPVLHLGRCLVGEGQGKDLRHADTACFQEVDIFLDKHVGLTGPAPAVTTMLRSCLVIASPWRGVAAMSGLLPDLEDPVGIEPADLPELTVPDSGISPRRAAETAVPDLVYVGKGVILCMLINPAKSEETLIGRPSGLLQRHQQVQCSGSLAA